MFHYYENENDQYIFEKLLHYTNAKLKHHNVSYHLSDRTDLNTIIILFNLPNAGDSYNWLVHPSSILMSHSTDIGAIRQMNSSSCRK
jgi:hypothetical protein